MENLFDNITNLRKLNILDEIEKTIKEEQNFVNNQEITQLCKVYSNNIVDNLNKKHIHATKKNLFSLTGIDHEIVVVKLYENNEEVIIVIDVTFKQFLPENNQIFKELINKKYFIASEEKLFNYFSIFKEINENKNKVIYDR